MHKKFTVKFNLIFKNSVSHLVLGVAFLLCASNSLAQETNKISIIIDDLGNNLHQGQTLINLPYQLTYSILPKRPYSKRLAKLAATSGKEVMVHLPMQSANQAELGNGALTLELTQQEFQESVRISIDSVPHARGVNNHMGSLLTQHPGHMTWLMEVLSDQESTFYFVDSKTTAQTVAGQIAREHLVPHIERDVFLDSSNNEGDIQKQLEYLTKVAIKKGYAVGIGHPYPVTIKLLVDYLPTLAAKNIEVVPVATIIKQHNNRNWTSLSSTIPANQHH